MLGRGGTGGLCVGELLMDPNPFNHGAAYYLASDGIMVKCVCVFSLAFLTTKHCSRPFGCLRLSGANRNVEPICPSKCVSHNTIAWPLIRNIQLHLCGQQQPHAHGNNYLLSKDLYADVQYNRRRIETESTATPMAADSKQNDQACRLTQASLQGTAFSANYALCVCLT